MVAAYLFLAAYFALAEVGSKVLPAPPPPAAAVAVVDVPATAPAAPQVTASAD